MPVSDETIYYINWGAGSIPVKIRYVYTSNTSASVEVFWILDDYSSEILDAMNDMCDDNYPNATRLSSATVKYNCHSYAWYSQDVDNNDYWMNNPSAFYSDYSYCTVSVPMVGDIICYFDDMGTSDTSDDINLHSGIVTEVLSGLSNGLCGQSDLVTVTSKWGAYGLYLHNGYECPYTAYASGGADYVRYYRNSHSNTYSSLGTAQHNVGCSNCNYEYVESHSYSYEKYTNTLHYCNCICRYTKTAPHVVRTLPSSSLVQCIYCKAWIDQDGPIAGVFSLNAVNYITNNGSYINANGIIILSDKDYELYLSGKLDLDAIICSLGCIE